VYRPRVVRDGEVLLGRVPVLEVLVPSLMGEVDLLYVSHGLVQELEYWKDEMKISHDVNGLRFSLGDGVVALGWDAVTGMWGRVVGVDVFGVVRTPSSIVLDRTMDNLNEAALAWRESGYSLEERKRVQKFTEEIGKLLQERRRKQGNVKKIVDYTV